MTNLTIDPARIAKLENSASRLQDGVQAALSQVHKLFEAYRTAEAERDRLQADMKKLTEAGSPERAEAQLSVDAAETRLAEARDRFRAADELVAEARERAESGKRTLHTARDYLEGLS